MLAPQHKRLVSFYGFGYTFSYITPPELCKRVQNTGLAFPSRAWETGREWADEGESTAWRGSLPCAIIAGLFPCGFSHCCSSSCCRSLGVPWEDAPTRAGAPCFAGCRLGYKPVLQPQAGVGRTYLFLNVLLITPLPGGCLTQLLLLAARLWERRSSSCRCSLTLRQANPHPFPHRP